MGAKAGLVMKLRSRCSVVAAQNCKGGSSRGRGASYDTEATVAVNSGLPPPLLSRFDIVCVFAPRSGAKDAATADFILQTRKPGDVEDAENSESTKQWNHERLRSYILWAKENQLPESTDPRAELVLTKYYLLIRQSESQGKGVGGVTVRAFESLLRLSQAHARLLNHAGVRLEDALAAVILHRAALQDHVVGAESSEELELDPETPACSLGMPARLGFNHNTDMRNEQEFRLVAERALAMIGLRQLEDGSLEECRQPVLKPLQQIMPLLDFEVQSQCRQASQPDSQGASRGRRLGCRSR